MTKTMPTAGDVTNCLVALGGRSTAKTLCDALVNRGFGRGNAQLAIQRATDGGRHIVINRDWTLSLAKKGVGFFNQVAAEQRAQPDSHRSSEAIVREMRDEWR